MQPLARQDTRPSIHSWWSDSNPGLRGPTINLHAAAKPLSRFLYRRQAVDIIKKNRGSPLSEATLEIYASYFPWDSVSWSTKKKILRELADRAFSSEIDACAMVESPVFFYVPQMLWSPDAGTRRSSCRILGNLAYHESTAPAILELKPYMQLVSLLCDDHSGVIGSAVCALSQIARWLDGAQAVVDANITDYILELLQSSDAYVRELTCELVGLIASHESTAPAILDLKPYVQLVCLLRDDHSEIIGSAMYALAKIAIWSDGAQAVVDAMTTDHVSELLQSPNADVRYWTCVLVGWIASHESTVPAILELQPYVQLLSLLRDNHSGVIGSAMRALASISKRLDGTQTIIDAKTTDHVLELLESPDADVRYWTCELVGWIASHESTLPAILDLKPYVQLICLLRDEHSDVVSSAMYTLAKIAIWSDGAQAVVDAMTTDHILELLQSPNADVREWTCELVGRIASHKSTAPAILELRPYVQLVSLLHDDHSDIVGSAMYALAKIAIWSDGAQAVIDAMTTDHVLELLQSSDAYVREWTCELVGRIASHESTARAILKPKPYLQLGS